MLTSDPHGVVPVGFKTFAFEVMGFFAPGGTAVLSLMVAVKYPNRPSDETYTTTLDYIKVLKDFLEVVGQDQIQKIKRQWLEARILDAEKK